MCENLLGRNSSIKKSDNDRMSEQVEKSQNIKKIGSDQDNLKRKTKYNELKQGHGKYSASTGLDTVERKVNTTEKCNKQDEKQKNSEDMRLNGKYIKERGDCQSKKETIKLGQITNPSQLSVNSHRSGKTGKRTRGLHQLECENIKLWKVSDTLESNGVENPAQYPKNEEDKEKDGSGSHVNHKILSKNMGEKVQSSTEIKRPKDLISNRKQQREAVDALLSSSLLPSKKYETSARSRAPKKTLSPSEGGILKPTKQQRVVGTQAETSGQLKDKSVDSSSSRKKK